MSTQKKELINIIEELPEELDSKVIDYVEYLKFMYTINKAPNNLIIKDMDDLIKKLQEGIKDVENGRVCSIEEAFAESKEILEN